MIIFEKEKEKKVLTCVGRRRGRGGGDVFRILFTKIRYRAISRTGLTGIRTAVTHRLSRELGTTDPRSSEIRKSGD